MIGLESFNLVLIGAFQVQQIDYTAFDFHGQVPVERLRVPPVFQAGVGEYSIEVIPGRFQVMAAASKATSFRAEALVGVAARFVDEYVGRRAIQAVGHNFTGTFRPPTGKSVEDFFAEMIDVDRVQRAADVDALIRQSVTVVYQATEHARATVQLEPSAKDATMVFYNVNFTFGADVMPNQPPIPLSTPVDEAIGAMEDVHALGDHFLEALLASDVSDG